MELVEINTNNTGGFMMTDSLADMFTRMRNNMAIKAAKVNIPYSKFKEAILNVLKNEKYIQDFQVKSSDDKVNIVVNLRYNDGQPAISHLKRLSKPGLRVYANYQKIPRPLQGMGLVIISTPLGVISGKEAWRKRVGGELICEVY